jgi:hypothetical protein
MSPLLFVREVHNAYYRKLKKRRIIMETFLHWSIAIVSSLVVTGMGIACVMWVNIRDAKRDTDENEDCEEE